MNGFYPGSGQGENLSSYLKSLNADGIKEGEHVYSLYSTEDEVIKYGGLVYEHQTGLWPNVDASKAFTYSHIEMRDKTKEI